MSEKKKLRVAVYCRVSTAQESQSLSYEMQKDYYEKYVNSNPNWTLTKIYADRGISGTKLSKNRKEFYKMMNDAGVEVIQTENKFLVETIPDKDSKFDLIIVKDEKRLARNSNISEIVNKLLVKKVGVYFETLGINTLEQNDLGLKILFDVSEDFSRNLSKNLKISYERAHLKNPKILGHYAPFGYKFDRNDKGERILIPISEEYIKIVNEIFDMYLDDNGYRLIAKFVNDRGFKTVTGKEFRKDNIENIIKNEKYYGVIQVIRHTPESLNKFGHTERFKMNYDLIKSDKIIPMITEEKFFLVQKKLKSKPISQNLRGVKTSKSKYFRKLICANCHEYYQKTIDSKGVPVYVCSSKRENLGSANDCKSPYVSEEFLNNFLEELFNNNTFVKFEKLRIQDIIDYFTFYKYCLISTFFKDRNEELIEELKIRVQEFDDKQNKLLDMFEGDIPIEVLKRKINQIQEEKSKYQKQLDKEDFSFENFKKDLKTIDEGIKKLQSFKIDNIKTKEELLEKIVIFIIPNKPDSTIRQKRNDCKLNYRSIYADDYQDLENSYLNNIMLKPDEEIALRYQKDDYFSEKEKKELDEKLKNLL